MEAEAVPNTLPSTQCYNVTNSSAAFKYILAGIAWNFVIILQDLSALLESKIKCFTYSI
jgi:hypothetical protein